jgi:hypothetical protein
MDFINVLKINFWPLSIHTKANHGPSTQNKHGTHYAGLVESDGR